MLLIITLLSSYIIKQERWKGNLLDDGNSSSNDSYKLKQKNI